MRIIWLILLLFIGNVQPCAAAYTNDTIDAESELSSMMDKLPDEVSEIVQAYKVKSGEGAQNVLKELKERCMDQLNDELHSLWRPITLILMTLTLCSMLEPIFTGSARTFVLTLFGCLQIVSVSLLDTRSLFREGIDALENLYDFSTVLLPCLAGVSVAAGASVSAGVKYTSASLFMNLLLNVSHSVLIPSISVYLAALIGDIVFKQKFLGAIARFVRWAGKTMITWSTIVFTAYLNVAGLIASSGDLFAERAAKTALSAALPVVGSIISDATSTLVAGAAVLRSSIGILGMLSVLGMLSIPFIKLGLRYLIYLGISRLSGLFPDRRFLDLLDGIAGAYGMLLGIIGSGFIMIFLTLISFMQIAGGG